MLKVEKLSFFYNKRAILDEISFEADYGSFITILGRNGAGKTTLLKSILGILPYHSGTISIDGMELKRLSIKERARLIGYIPQLSKAVFPYRVFDMIFMGTTAALKGFKNPGKQEEEAAREAIAALKLEHLQDRIYTQLSGGEQQLVLIARALAQKSKILIMDEPCSGLDYGNQIKVLEEVKKLSENGYLILTSVHNPDQAFIYADRTLVLENKRITVDAAPNIALTEEKLSSLYGTPLKIYSPDSGIRICYPTTRRR